MKEGTLIMKIVQRTLKTARFTSISQFMHRISKIVLSHNGRLVVKFASQYKWLLINYSLFTDMTEGWHLWEIFIYKFYQTFPNGSGFFCKLLNPILYENINSTNSDGDILCQIYFFERV